MKRTKIMEKLFSDGNENFKKMFADAVEEAKENGEATITEDGEDITVKKDPESEVVYAEDAVNGEVTAVTETADDYKVEPVDVEHENAESAAKENAEEGTKTESATFSADEKKDLMQRLEQVETAVTKTIPEALKEVADIKATADKSGTVNDAPDPISEKTFTEDDGKSAAEMAQTATDMQKEIGDAINNKEYDKVKELTASAGEMLKKCETLSKKYADTKEEERPSLQEVDLDGLKDSVEKIKTMGDEAITEMENNTDPKNEDLDENGQPRTFSESGNKSGAQTSVFSHLMKNKV